MRKAAFTACISIIFLVGTTASQNASRPDCDIQPLAIAAAMGDSLAQYNLAVEFYKGTCVERDYSKSAILWGKAIMGGDINADNNLGYLTYFGMGVKPNHAEGIRLWRVAAQKGMCESQVHLADAYSDGKYLKIDVIESYAWAATAKHCAGFEGPDSKEAITKMAEGVLEKVMPSITAAQLSTAKLRAKTYSSRFVVK